MATGLFHGLVAQSQQRLAGGRRIHEVGIPRQEVTVADILSGIVVPDGIVPPQEALHPCPGSKGADEQRFAKIASEEGVGPMGAAAHVPKEALAGHGIAVFLQQCQMGKQMADEKT